MPAGATSVYNLLSESINDQGVVVGSSSVGGWIWDSGNGTRLLNGSAPSGWNVFSAISISNNGLILGQGSYDAGPYQWIQLVPALPATPA